MFSEATMDLNPSIHQPKDMFFLPVFAYLLLVFLMLALSCLNLTLFNPSLEEGISAHTLPLRTCCWPDPPLSRTLGFPSLWRSRMQLPSTFAQPTGAIFLPSLTLPFELLYSLNFFQWIWATMLCFTYLFFKALVSQSPSPHNNVEFIYWNWLEDILNKLSHAIFKIMLVLAPWALEHGFSFLRGSSFLVYQVIDLL